MNNDIEQVAAELVFVNLLTTKANADCSVTRWEITHCASKCFTPEQLIRTSTVRLEHLAQEAGLFVHERQYLSLRSDVPLPNIDSRELVRPAYDMGLTVRMRLKEMEIGQSVYVDQENSPDYATFFSLLKKARGSMTNATKHTGFHYTMRVSGESFTIWRVS